MKISTILDHIDSGHMALPEFQRGYVRNRDQVRRKALLATEANRRMDERLHPVAVFFNESTETPEVEDLLTGCVRVPEASEQPVSKIQWEYDLVESPSASSSRRMGWQWMEGDTDRARIDRAHQLPRGVAERATGGGACASSICATASRGSMTRASPVPSAIWSRQPVTG